MLPIKRIRSTIVLLALAASCTNARDKGESVDANGATRDTRVIADRYDLAQQIPVKSERRICLGRDEDACAFSGISSGLLLVNGDVVLSDAGSAVHEFDTHGQMVRSFGRRGFGPGETQAVAGLGERAAGGLTVFDMVGLHIIQYERNATHHRTVAGRIVREAVDMRFADSAYAFLAMRGADSIGTTVPAHIVSFNMTGDSTLLALFSAKARSHVGSTAIELLPPFTPEVRWDFRGPSTAVVATGSDFSFTLFSGGKPQFRLRSDLGAQPVSPADADSARYERRHPGGGRRSQAFGYNERIEALLATLPSQQPAIARLKLARDGLIWVQSTKASKDSVTGKRMTRWDIFGVDGTRKGYVLLPTTSRMLDAVGGRVLVNDLDATGRLFAEVYSMSAPPGQR